MSRFLPLAALFLSLLAAPLAPARAEVTVSFVDPQRYVDAGDYGSEAERNLAALKQFLQTEGQRCLTAGETLAFQVHDVDLAGRQEWWHGRGYGNLRVMREITWPKIDIAYVRRDAGGATVAEGRERVADMSYLWRAPYLRHDIKPLPYERAMLKDWIGRRFCGDAQ